MSAPTLPSPAQSAALVRRIVPGGSLRGVASLAGGVSARSLLFDVLRPDETPIRFIVRIHGEADRQRNPHIAADEFRLLQRLHALGMRVPAPLALVPAGAISEGAALALAYVDGAPAFSPADLAQHLYDMAAQLVAIHRVIIEAHDLAFLPDQRDRVAALLAHPPADADAQRIQQVLRSVDPPPRHHPPVLLHGDYWPGNVLWRDGQVAAVIDWEDAAQGDPLADLANSRLEILWAHGDGAMQTFTRIYRQLSGVDAGALPYWDVWAALRPIGKLGAWGLEPALERTMRAQHREFLAHALAQLAP